MKLKHKLIPLASAAAVCATVAPITLTSCGGGTNLLGRYRAKYAQHEYGYYSNIEATQEYTKSLTEHNDLFKDDLLWSKSQYYNNMETVILGNIFDKQVKPPVSKLLKIDEARANVSNIKFKTQPYEYRDEDLDIPTLSFDLEYSTRLSFDLTNYIESLITSGLYSKENAGTIATFLAISSIDLRVSMSFTDVPYWFSYDASDTPLDLRSIWAGIVPSDWAFMPIYQLMTLYAQETPAMDLPLAWGMKVKLDATINRNLTIYDQEIIGKSNFNFDYNLASANMKEWYGGLGNSDPTDPDATVKTIVFYTMCLPDGFVLEILNSPNGSALWANTLIVLLTAGGGCALSHYMAPADYKEEK